MAKAGEIHDCDVQLSEVAAFLEELQVHLRARRNALFEEFLVLWRDFERKGFAARLAFALSERSQSIES